MSDLGIAGLYNVKDCGGAPVDVDVNALPLERTTDPVFGSFSQERQVDVVRGRCLRSSAGSASSG